MMDEDCPASPDPDCPASPDHEGPASPGGSNSLQEERMEGPQIPLHHVDLDTPNQKQAGVIRRTALWKRMAIRRGDTDLRVHDKNFSSNLAAANSITQENFVKLFQRSSDLALLYRTRPVYGTIPSAEIFRTVKQAYEDVPEIRPLVLSFIGRLVHETSHIFYCKIEKTNTHSHGNAMARVVQDMLPFFKETLAQYKDVPFALDIIRGISQICSELFMMNEQRPSFSQAKLNGPDGFYGMFRKSESINSLLNLLDFTIEFLVEVDRIDLGLAVLVEAECSNTTFKWMWSHLLYKYTDMISKRILHVGVRHFEKQLNVSTEHKSEAQLQNLNNDFNQRLQILVEIISFLLLKQYRELREVVRDLFSNSLSEEVIEGKSKDCSFAFLFKLATAQDLTRFIAESLKDFVTPTNILLGFRHLNVIWKRAIMSGFDFKAFTHQLLVSLDIPKFPAFFATIIEICLNSRAFGTLQNVDINHAQSVRQGAVTVFEDMILRILPMVHQKASFDITFFSGYAHGEQLQMCIDECLANPNLASTLIKYFHILSIAYGEQKGVEIVCRFIFAMRQPKQFDYFCAYLSSISAYFPNLMQHTYEALIEQRQNIEIEKQNRGNLKFASSLLWLMNLRILIGFDQNAEKSDTIKYLRLHPGTQTGPLLSGILSWVIERMEIELEATNKQRLFDAVICVEKLLKVLAPIVEKKPAPKPPGKQQTVLLRSGDAYKIAMQLSKVFQLTLSAIRYEAGETNQEYDILSINSRLREAIGRFFHVQMNHLCSYYFSWFLLSFVESCLQASNELFGETVEFAHNVPGSLNSYYEANFEDETVNLLEGVNILAERKKANQLAHSGIIGKGARKFGTPISEHEQLRRIVFLDSVYTLLASAPKERQLKTARSLALLLLDRFCGDAVTGTYIFADFDTEKEMISRYLKVSQRLATPIGDGLLTIISQIPPCLYFAAPILKAAILETMNLFDSSVERLERKPTDVMLLKIDRWMRIGIKGGILPTCLLTLAEIIPVCCAHEAFLLFNEVYNYLKTSPHFQVEGERRLAKALRGETVLSPELMRTTGLLELLVAILERDIATRGKHLPIILRAFSKLESDSPDTTFQVIDEIQEPDPEN